MPPPDSRPMIGLVAAAPPLPAGADVVAVPFTGDLVVGAGAEALAALGVDADALLAVRQAKGTAGEVLEAPVGRDGVDTALLVGIGDGSIPALRKAGAATARRAGTGRVVATAVVDGRDAEAVRAYAEGAALAAYSFSRR